MQKNVHYDLGIGGFFCKKAGVQLLVALQLGIPSQFPGASAERRWVPLRFVAWGSGTEPPDTQASHPLGWTVTAMKIPSEGYPVAGRSCGEFKGKYDDSVTGWPRCVVDRGANKCQYHVIKVAMGPS